MSSAGRQQQQHQQGRWLHPPERSGSGKARPSGNRPGGERDFRLIILSSESESTPCRNGGPDGHRVSCHPVSSAVLEQRSYAEVTSTRSRAPLFFRGYARARLSDSFGLARAASRRDHCARGSSRRSAGGLPCRSKAATRHCSATCGRSTGEPRQRTSSGCGGYTIGWVR